MSRQSEIMDLAGLVAEMRSAQKKYFKARSRSALIQSKALEARGDAALVQIKRGGSADLFSGARA